VKTVLGIASKVKWCFQRSRGHKRPYITAGNRENVAFDFSQSRDHHEHGSQSSNDNLDGLE
jgi:hypothetical protein